MSGPEESRRWWVPLFVAGLVTLAFASMLGNYLSGSDELEIGQGPHGARGQSTFGEL